MIPRKIVVTSVAVAISLLGDAALYTVLPIYAEQLGIKLALVGVLLSVNRYVRLLTNSLAGRIHDSFHTSWPFIISLILGATTTVMYGLLWGFWTFLAARMIWGLCWSFIRLEGFTTVIIESPPNYRGKMMGAFNSIVGSGQMIGGFLGGVLTDTIGYRNCLLSLAGLILLVAGAIFWERSQTRKPQPVKTEELDSTKFSEAIFSSASQPPQDKLDRTQTPKLWIIYLMGFTNILVNHSAIVSTLGRLLKIRFGMSVSFWRISVGAASATGFLLFMRWLASFLSAPILGHVSDRAGRRIVTIFGLIVGICTLLCLATQKNFFLVSLAAIISSVSSTAISVSLDASIADVVAEHQRGRLVSRYVTFTDLGSATGPLVSYLLLSVGVGLEWVYLGGLALLVASCVFYGLSFVSTSSRTSS